MNKALFLGHGYVARALAARLAPRGWTVAATIRDAARGGDLRRAGAEPVLWTAAGVDAGAVAGADAILVSTPPAGGLCPALGAARETLLSADRKPSWIGYLSTNGVYGDHGGDWVDEAAPLNPTSPRAKARIAAEEGWRALGAAANIPVVIFRLPGIYGPGRSAFDAIRAGRAQRIYKEGQVFSRAHVDDIAAALFASLSHPDAGELFNIADDEPAPPQDVVAYACELLGVPPPPLVPIEEANLSEMAKSFYADNKRVSNARMKARLTPRLVYPTYREGLAAILRDERATGIPG